MNELDETVHIVEYDEGWPERFLTERARIESALAISSERVQHIGSTAVAGLPAKPVIDIMIGVDGWPPAEIVSEDICRLNYQALGEAGVPERLYFRKRRPTDYNVHVVRFDGGHWRSNIALCKYLRSCKSARDRYAEAKRNAISYGAATLLAYSAAKSSIVAQLMEEALCYEKSN